MSVSDVAAVAELVLRERQSRDRGWWDRWTQCFAEESVVDMSWFTGSGAEFVRQTRRRSADGVWGRHRLSPPAVQVDGSRAWAELPLAIEFRVMAGGAEADLVSYCRSQYRAEHIGGRWQIRRITSIYERDSLTPAVPGTTLDLDPALFAAHRPSYRCLAWYLERTGSTISADLLGDDRPEDVARQYEAEAAWLHQTSLSPTGTTHPTKEN
ncbi:nuclear transport factor 2 family protein [Aeromicrobium chenweiae]|uniref:SnoaL-like domain-containing protein n=1 Tax=Aeromicrobium chenweiae TaxID=2079793 RepID=A0A2S0WM85_9ACTN|nr:nuclear transport factor 2 family protein [Aeromicrobium chenweiae]AWB92417.1 hypothetical protein C3E78_09500 [Aeromicrobium chenweiae]TGN31295.1 hypothetical protein E4L97_13070 [Aeromicrobium chenweiae]